MLKVFLILLGKYNVSLLISIKRCIEVDREGTPWSEADTVMGHTVSNNGENGRLLLNTPLDLLITTNR